MNFQKIVDRLLASRNPSIRWKTLVNVLGEDESSSKMKRLSREIQKSNIAKSLLQDQNASGQIASKHGVYDKWQGAHWVLATLADIGYPRGERTLFPARDQILETWLSPMFYKDFEVKRRQDAYQKKGVPVLNGKHRRCASQQGYPLHFLIKLGIEDQRVHDLAERLLHWQWPDGGWNCDKSPDAVKSSFVHTAISLRGLNTYSKHYKKYPVAKAVKRAAEVILSRRLFRKRSDSEVIDKEFLHLHYPLYWHYDILGTLKIFCETGDVSDPRCDEAVELILKKMIPNEGWPAERKYYRSSGPSSLGRDCVDWGGTGAKKANDWITVDVMQVLKSRKMF